MTFIQNLFDSLPSIWAVLALIAAIGLSVLFIRGLLKLAVRAFLIGTFGLLVIGVIYYFL